MVDYSEVVTRPPLTVERLRSFAPDDVLYRDAGVPAWLDELDLKVAPPHLKMGTHSLATEDCLVVDQFRDMEVALRNRLLDEEHDTVFAALPSADDASQEVLELVGEHLARAGVTPPNAVAARHPLEVAGRAVQEDLCLMIPRDGGWFLDAGVLCFPTIWSLAAKLGRPTSEVHGTVVHYAGELAERVDRYFDAFRPGRAVWRRNLSIKPFPLLYLPVTKAAQPVGVLACDDDGAPFWLRTERQTLQRLPRSGAILFTIKLQLAPAAVLRQRPDRARDLVEMYRSWDAAMWDYKVASNDLAPGFIPWLTRLGTDAETARNSH